NVVRISLRSVDDFPCNEMSARFFNGGGHMNAAGGRLECSMDEAVKRFHEAVKSYEALLK
ncbi:MAG: bifunctional oligoribonuclease/PAP phosphatase NrnA, partial [Bacteroidaceae bacterium]|nr:bifunctional oligoribonuclease/PAP phosphatase NrnA [Bacteroidaceae bacterium]